MILDAELQTLNNLIEQINVIKKCINVEELTKIQELLKKEQECPDFWNDLEKAQNINKKAKQIENKIKSVKSITNQFDYLTELSSMLMEEDENEEEKAEFVTEVKKLSKQVEATYLETLLNGKYDDSNAIITIHSGAGGTESQDWANMLYRMYTRFCERSGYKLKVLDIQEGDVVGLKGITFLVEGENAYGYLKAEKGVHRLVRISPFDSGARRHTSFASIEVMPEIKEDNSIVIDEKDLRIDTYHSSGAGGQNVNKTESAIRITHIPTGIVVNCQIERSQMQNKATAFAMLRSKLAELKEQEEEAKRKDIQGDLKKIEWGSQIRSYVFCPYTMVKDHRTNFDTPNITAVMDGDIMDFITTYLTMKNKKSA